MLLAALALAACDSTPQYLDGASGTTYTYSTDIPCDVNTVLQANCLSCHGSPPAAAPISLASYQDLTASSQTDPTKKVVERAVLRMQGTPSQMPPAPAALVAATDIQVLQSWITAGTPAGSCTVTGTATCQSGKSYSGGGGSAYMNPGMACITCHKSNGDGPVFQIAGTVFPALHEADKCISAVGTSVTVVITDAAGTVVTLPVNSSGNFSYGGSRRSGALQLPFTAKVVAADGKVRAMSSPQENGDCNSCHTVGGANGAPGRIMAP
jgi:mono/diheme cytochrome c family protein